MDRKLRVAFLNLTVRKVEISKFGLVCLWIAQICALLFTPTAAMKNQRTTLVHSSSIWVSSIPRGALCQIFVSCSRNSYGDIQPIKFGTTTRNMSVYSFHVIDPSLALPFECLRMCADVLEMCVSVPGGTYSELRTTVHVLSLNNCGFRSELPLAVHATFVSSSFPELVVSSPDIAPSKSLTATLQF